MIVPNDPLNFNFDFDAEPPKDPRIHSSFWQGFALGMIVGGIILTITMLILFYLTDLTPTLIQ